jgi:tungstate transport system permease protein
VSAIGLLGPATSLLALPLVVAVVLVALRRVPVSARETLATHGAPPMMKMTWLLTEARSAVISAILLAFGRVFTELGAALILGGNIRGATRTLTTYIALEYSRGDDARAIALGLILLAVAVATNTVVHLVSGDDR